jgi:parallel beta-helix repeat protein
MDSAGNIDQNTSQQAITTLGAAGALYVDVTTGANTPSCGTSGSPCKTITYALAKSPGNQTIHVAKGLYDAASGETFPIQLKPGTIIAGEGYWWNGQKVIKETFIEGTTPMILGADNASIISCYLLPTAWATTPRVIDDAGHNITVYHCTIDGTKGPGLQGVGFYGGSSLIGSRVENFSGGGGRGVSVWGAGNAVINDNVVVNNSHGIEVGTSNVVISNNWVEDIYSTGIGVGVTDSLNTGIVVFRNYVKNVGIDGISIMSATDTRVVRNVISDVGGYGISLWNYQQPTNMVDVLNNTVMRGTTVGIHVIDGGARIIGNYIVCNVGGVFVRSDQVIDLSGNSWDHDTPTIDDGRGPYDPGCDGTYDICYEAAYALTPAPFYLPSGPRGSCIIGVLPPPFRAPER